MASINNIPTYDQAYQDYQMPDWMKAALKSPQNPNAPSQSAYTYDPNTATNAYTGTETSAIDKLNDIIKYGGYSPEQTNTMVQGAMQPVLTQAEQDKQKAQADAYARGVGQSSVLNRGYSDIDKNVLSQLATITGNVTQQGAAQVLPAIQAVQSGSAQKADLQEKSAEFDANLKAQLHMNDQQIQETYDQMQATANMSDADRALKYEQIKNQYNLDEDQLNYLIQAANNDAALKQNEQTSDFWSNLLGSITSAGGAVLGKVL